MSRVKSLFTVRNSLLAIVGLLATALAGVTGWEAWSVRAEQEAAAHAREAKAIAALATGAAHHWAEERSAVQLALLLEEPASDAIEETIERHRNQGNALYQQAVERLAEVDAIQVQNAQSKADLAFDNTEFMRGLAAEDAVLPRGDRDDTLPEAWFESMTELVVAARDFNLAILAQAGTASAEVERLSALNHDVWLVDEYARHQTAILGAAIATEGLLDSETVAGLARIDGHVEQAWESLDLYLANVQADPKVARALADLKAAYFDDFAPLREKSVTAGSFGSTYPVDTAEWFAVAGRVGEAAAAVDTAVGDAASALTAQAVARDQWRFAVAAALFVVAVVAGLASLWLVARRVVAPIGHITDVLTRLTAGEDEMAVRYTGRSDEIGGMARAVEELRTAVRKAFRLQQMVEEMPISVLTCDAGDGLRMDYVNAESRRILGPLEDHLAVPIEQAVGHPIDVYTIFHKDADEQHRLLADPENLPLSRKIRVGAEWLDVRADAIFGRDGRYVGPMITWNVITERMKLAEKFEANIQSVVETVSSAANEMQATASSMSGTAEETTRQAAAVSSASEQASSSVQTVASATEEMAASVKEVGSQASRSTEVARTAVDQAEETNRTIGGLNEAATKIGEVVSLISDIADQTNLLALNATIEAARAGEAGKGFAVVADEVKALANQTANATEEIARQISAMQTETKNAVGAIGGIGKTIAAIDDAASAIAAAVEQQAASIEEIAQNAQQAAQGTDEVSSNIGGVTQAAGETGQSAQQVLTAAQQMSGESETLRREVAAFLEEVRAA